MTFNPPNNSNSFNPFQNFQPFPNNNPSDPFNTFQSNTFNNNNPNFLINNPPNLHFHSVFPPQPGTSFVTNTYINNSKRSFSNESEEFSEYHSKRQFSHHFSEDYEFNPNNFTPKELERRRKLQEEEERRRHQNNLKQKNISSFYHIFDYSKQKKGYSTNSHIQKPPPRLQTECWTCMARLPMNPNDISECNGCNKKTCYPNCVRSCESCTKLYCSHCMRVDYRGAYETNICLDCNMNCGM